MYIGGMSMLSTKSYYTDNYDHYLEDGEAWETAPNPFIYGGYTESECTQTELYGAIKYNGKCILFWYVDTGKEECCTSIRHYIDECLWDIEDSSDKVYDVCFGETPGWEWDIMEDVVEMTTRDCAVYEVLPIDTSWDDIKSRLEERLHEMLGMWVHSTF